MNSKHKLKGINGQFYKNGIVFLLLIIIFAGFLKSYSKGYASIPKAPEDTCKECCDYKVSNGKVYLADEVIAGADTRSFSCVKDEYSKDKNYVYFRYTRVKGADPATFKVLEWGYSKDKSHVYFDYYSGNTIKNADPGSFVVFDLGISKDKNSVFILTDDNKIKKLTIADAKTFRAYHGYYYDKKYLFGEQGEILAKRDTFDIKTLLK